MPVAGTKLPQFDPMEGQPKRRGYGAPPKPRTFEGDGVSWTVTLPDRTRAALSARKPRAQVRVQAGEQEQTLWCPVAVARQLIKEGCPDPAPSSFSEYLEFQDRVATGCAVSRLRGLVDRRDYSRLEAERKLKEDGYWPPVIEDVLTRACAGRLLDDGRFAETFIRSKVSAGWGPVRIERELARRGIAVDEVPGWREEFLEEDEEQRAWELVERRSVPSKNPYEKTVRFLVSRGFGYDIAKRCASRLRDRLRDEEGLE